MTVDRMDLSSLLVSGGDDRLYLDPTSGLNMYGYGPTPRPHDLAFSSSTASTITTRGFASVSESASQIQWALASADAATVYAREAEILRARLAKALGLGPNEADVVLAASGTDLHLIVASLLRGQHGRSVLTIALSGNETGSGVGLAVSGKHAMRHLVSGRIVAKGDTLDADTGLAVSCQLVRDDGGDLRTEDLVHAELDETIALGLAHGLHCLLVIADVSKTGLIAPSLETAFALKARFGDRLDILIDACQFRVRPETIRAYLAKDCLVAVTGSKFLGGPIFSGALLVPKRMADDLKHVGLPPGLADYSGAGDWPTDWLAARTLPRRANFGLLLRWQAAIVELEALLVHHELKIAWVMLRFSEAVRGRLRSDDRFEAVPMRRLDRDCLDMPISYDAVPSIFPFLLRSGQGLLDSSEATSIYQQLSIDTPAHPAVRLGQPVALGCRDGHPVSALRLCLSAPLISAAAVSEEALAGLIAQAMTALDRTADMVGARFSHVA